MLPKARSSNEIKPPAIDNEEAEAPHDRLAPGQAFGP